MKKFLCTFFLCLLIAVTLGVSARAAEDILKVGLRYGGTALSSASLESVQGGGFSLGMGMAKAFEGTGRRTKRYSVWWAIPPSSTVA